MIKLEFPKANLAQYRTTEEKLLALKGQVDTLSNNLRIMLDSIDESIDEESIREIVAPDIDSIAGSVDELSERTDELSERTDGLEGRDYIVEQGTSGIWTYRKWNSGVAECWGIYSNTISASTVSNGNYINYPFTFIAIPCITIGLSAGGADLYDAHIEQSGTTTTQVRLTMINRYTSSVAMKVNMVVIGRWK